MIRTAKSRNWWVNCTLKYAQAINIYGLRITDSLFQGPTDGNLLIRTTKKKCMSAKCSGRNVAARHWLDYGAILRRRPRSAPCRTCGSVISKRGATSKLRSSPNLSSYFFFPHSFKIGDQKRYLSRQQVVADPSLFLLAHRLALFTILMKSS